MGDEFRDEEGDWFPSRRTEMGSLEVGEGAWDRWLVACEGAGFLVIWEVVPFGAGAWLLMGS